MPYTQDFETVVLARHVCVHQPQTHDSAGATVESCFCVFATGSGTRTLEKLEGY